MKFTKSKYRALSTIFSNFSEAFLISLIVPFLSGFDINKSPVLIFGVTTTLISVWISLLFAEKGRL